jgi:hypothetical protein
MSIPGFEPSDLLKNTAVPDAVTLRDYLAGQALAGFMRVRDGELFNEQKIKWYAKIAYELADAMLEERTQDEAKQATPLPKPAVQAQVNPLWRQLGVTPS